MKKVILNNGVKLPVIELGTPRIVKTDKDYLRESFNLYSVFFLSTYVGCNFYDTSAAYGECERIMGNVLQYKERSRIVISTKLSNHHQRIGDVERALKDSMRRLKTRYIDLYLMHWPQTDTFVDCWLQMENLYKRGYVRAIGVCNFHQHHLEKILDAGTVVPAVNQFEMHPLFTQKPLIEYCKGLGIQVAAYTPLGRMHDKLIHSKVLIQLGQKYQKTIPQVILRWVFQLGLISVMRTGHISRLKSNIDIFDFKLTNEEMEQIDGLNENLRLRYDPDNCDFRKL